MAVEAKSLGTLRPVGGGDPVPLLKPELTIGRRKSCDICLDFENISGRHCALVLDNGVWHVRDLNSTNGTTLNGQAVGANRGVMPDDEVGIAGHLYTIDYEPAGAVMTSNTLLEDEFSDGRPRRSLLELAGLESEGGRGSGRGKGSSSSSKSADRAGASTGKTRTKAAASSTDREELEERETLSDDEYLRLFEEPEGGV